MDASERDRLTVLQLEQAIQDFGDIALVAAMRAYVDGKLGEEVDLPG